MGSSKLVKNAKLPTSREVAEYGYRAMMAGKRIAVHGKRNKLLTQMPRFLPRALVVKLVAKAQST